MRLLVSISLLLVGLVLGFGLSAIAQRHPETFSGISPEMNKTISINIDQMEQYEMNLLFIHGGESIKVKPITVWEKVTKKKDRL